MVWFLGVVVLLLVGGIVVVAAGTGEGLSPAETDEPRPALPEGPLTAGDLRAVTFSTAVRGYRADEVDALLARLAAQLDEDA